MQFQFSNCCIFEQWNLLIDPILWKSLMYSLFVNTQKNLAIDTILSRPTVCKHLFESKVHFNKKNWNLLDQLGIFLVETEYILPNPKESLINYIV